MRFNIKNGENILIINKTDNTNFNGIYRIKNTPKNIQEIQEHVLPMYEYLKHQPSIIFPGSNPFKAAVDIVIELTAKLNSSSIQWVKMNASNHKLDIVDKQEDFLHIVTSEKDISEIGEYLQKRMEQRNSFKTKIKRLFTREPQEEIPEHLQLLSAAVKENNKESAAFEDFLAKRNKKIVETTSPQDLLTKILTER